MQRLGQRTNQLGAEPFPAIVGYAGHVYEEHEGAAQMKFYFRSSSLYRLTVYAFDGFPHVLGACVSVRRYYLKWFWSELVIKY